MYRKIVFVAHSLGGLVVQDALAQSRNSAEPHIRQIEHCTMGLLFLGTPHHGANLAAWASLASRMTRLLRRPNSDIVDVLTPGSEVLSRIQREFNNFLRTRQEGGHPISVTCFYEELPVAIVGEVRALGTTRPMCHLTRRVMIADMERRLCQETRRRFMATKRTVSMPIIK